MATVKRLNTPYTIDTTDVIVTGNLTVRGTQTTIESENAIIKDNLITLNSGETGPGVTLQYSGIEIDRGYVDGNVVANVKEYTPALGWNESIEKWVITSDGVTFANIAAFTGNASITSVADDPNPTLGGNLNTVSYEIFSSADNVTINDTLELTNQSTPANISASSILYANTIGGGTTGIYVVNDEVIAGEELITKTRAFGFSLIL